MSQESSAELLKTNKIGVGGAENNSVSPDQWRKVHWLTPLLLSGHLLSVFIAFIFFRTHDLILNIQKHWSEISTSLSEQLAFYFFVAGLVAVAILFSLALYSYVAWTRIRFVVTADTVVYEYGILFKNSKHLRVDRLQSVDVVRPFIAGILGLGYVRLDTAGTSDPEVDIKYLTIAKAQSLREEILLFMRKSHQEKLGLTADEPGIDAAGSLGETAGVNTDANADAAPGGASGVRSEKISLKERITLDSHSEVGAEVLRVSNKRLIMREILQIHKLILFPLSIIIALVPLFLKDKDGFAFSLSFVLLAVSVVASIWKAINGSWSMSLRVTPDGIRVRRGLTMSVTQTLRPDRILGVRLSQTIVEHLLDWWTVEVDVAGYKKNSGSDESGSFKRNLLLMAGTREEALLLLWMLIPDLGVDNPQILMENALYGTQTASGFISRPARAVWLDPITWRRGGALVTPQVMMFRDRSVRRSLVVVPVGRTQGLFYKQGPLSRRLGLAKIGVAMVGGIRATTHHLDANEALALFQNATVRARNMRKGEDLSLWYKRMDQVYSGKVITAATDPFLLGAQKHHLTD